LPEEGSERGVFNIKEEGLFRVHVRVPALKGLMSRITQSQVHVCHYEDSLDRLFLEKWTAA